MPAGQSQKEFFVNEALCRVDALLHPSIEGEADEPPADPVEGESWLIGGNPSGEWSAQAGSLASFQAGGWIFAAPRDGMRLLDRSTGQDIRYSNGWQRIQKPDEPTGGVIIDSEARTVIAQLISALTASGILV